MSTQLTVESLSVKTEHRYAVRDVDLVVPAGSVVALLGPNGAGKSELVLAIAGAIPSTGAISIGDTSLTGLGVQAVRAAGVSAVPEGHQVLAGLNVLDNLKSAGPMLNRSELMHEVEQTLNIFPELRKHLTSQAGNLSGGQQQMLAIGQALISRPRFLLLDEMSLGLAPVIIERLVSVVHELRNKGLGILLIEQFTQLALSLADYCYVLSQGSIQFADTPEVLENNPGVLEKAYLGT